MIRVLVVEDYAAIRQPLAFMIDHEPDMTVVGQAGSVAEARSLLLGVDVAVIDLDLQGESGAELIRHLQGINPETSVLVLTGSTDPRVLRQAIEAGAEALMHKTADMTEIIDALRRLSAGEQLISVGQATILTDPTNVEEQTQAGSEALSRLSPREREILYALAEGLSDKEIASRLQIGVETVRTHLVAVRRKLHVNSRVQLAVIAVRYGLDTTPGHLQ